MVASGSCQPGDYYGPPLTRAADQRRGRRRDRRHGHGLPGAADAPRGLPTRDIAQTDDLSGGQTVTQVPLIESTAPIQDETLYGAFIASAQIGAARAPRLASRPPAGRSR